MKEGPKWHTGAVSSCRSNRLPFQHDHGNAVRRPLHVRPGAENTGRAVDASHQDTTRRQSPITHPGPAQRLQLLRRTPRAQLPADTAGTFPATSLRLDSRARAPGDRGGKHDGVAFAFSADHMAALLVGDSLDTDL